jgi:CRISPR-associated protein Csd1
MEKLVDDITAAFDKDDFVADGPLSGEFLLGYHCQRRDLHSPAQSLEDEQHPDE